MDDVNKAKTDEGKAALAQKLQDQGLNYPLAVKILSNHPMAKHKTEVGGLKLDIKDIDALVETFGEIQENIKSFNERHPDKQLPLDQLQGFKLEEMIKGDHEIGIKLSHDKGSGLHMLEVGLGGIEIDITNKLKGGSVAIPVPLTNKADEDVERLIKQSPLNAFFKEDENGHAYREMKPADMKDMKSQLLGLSQAIGELPLSEITINPMKIRDPRNNSDPEQSKLVTVDAKVTVDLEKAEKFLGKQ